MKLYADAPVRRTRQIVADAITLLWIWWWGSLGYYVFDKFRDAGRYSGGKLEGTGQNVVGAVTDTASTAAGVPLVGDSLAEQVRKLTGVGTDISDLGADLRHQLSQTGMLLGVLTALFPILLAIGFWLLTRGRYPLSATRNLPKDLTAPDSIERLALMALVNGDGRKIARIHPNAMQAWRDGDVEVMRRLAALQLGEVGVNLPPMRKPVRTDPPEALSGASPLPEAQPATTPPLAVEPFPATDREGDLATPALEDDERFAAHPLEREDLLLEDEPLHEPAPETYGAPHTDPLPTEGLTPAGALVDDIRERPQDLPPTDNEVDEEPAVHPAVGERPAADPVHDRAVEWPVDDLPVDPGPHPAPPPGAVDPDDPLGDEPPVHPGLGLQGDDPDPAEDELGFPRDADGGDPRGGIETLRPDDRGRS